MKEISISKSSRLYKLFLILSTIPFYSSFIKNNYYGLSSFNDVCTFCRHLVMALIVTIIYLLVSLMFINIAIVQPLIIFFTDSSSPSGLVSLYFYSFIVTLYFILLISNKITDNLPKFVNFDTPFIQNKTSAIKDVFKIVTNKHDNFCNRLKIED